MASSAESSGDGIAFTGSRNTHSVPMDLTGLIVIGQVVHEVLVILLGPVGESPCRLIRSPGTAPLQSVEFLGRIESH